ncbi:MAG: ABC transporter permease [Anaerolineae bacterium]|nr:ABC transporter permease [Anaerolineae bacterium]
MQAYIIRRILIIFPLLLGLSLFMFLLIRLAPGDPTLFYLPPDRGVDPAIRERVMVRLGLDQPLYIQYWRWLSSAVQGDFGYAYGYGEPALSLIRDRLPATVQLQAAALLLALTIALPIGIISATRQYSLLDNAVTSFAFFGLSMPNFWFALLLIFLFAVRLDWLPAVGDGADKVLHERLTYLIMPALVLAFNDMALYARFMRSSMLEVIRQDYVTTAYAKGLRESAVLFKHALKNAILPMITIVGLSLPRLLGGSIIVESIFAWPGIGRLGYDAVLRRDFPTIMALTILTAAFVMIVNLIVDITYSFADPRIVYGRKERS